MFTGIVQAVGEIRSLETGRGGARLRVAAGDLGLGDAAAGESIAVAGVCLTVTDFDAGGFQADVSGETLRLTTLGERRPGDRVNLERALRADDRLGGHFVTGHVDGVARVEAFEPDGDSRRLALGLPPELAQYVARKGSLTVDGVSLTVNAVAGDSCQINLVPHTLAVTTLGDLDAEARVNVEVDLLARYLARLTEAADG